MAEEQPPRLAPRTLLMAGAALGLVMVLLALGWTAGIRGRDMGAYFPEGAPGALALGALAGAGFAAVEWRYLSLLGKEAALIDQLIDLEALHGGHITALALLAAVPEELLFRGAALPELGVVGSALLFGLAHAVSRRYFLYATIAGLFLGLLMQWTGGLWAPIAAHAAVDIIMLALLARNRPAGGW